MTAHEQRYEKDPDFVFRTILDELILVPIRQNVADMESIFTLDEVGAFIWEKLDGQTSLAEIQSAILEEYEADPEAVGEDLEVFVHQLEAIGAVRRV